MTTKTTTVEVSDQRSPKDFRGMTFSRYKLSDAKKQLLSALESSHIEASCYWSAEMLCAGHWSMLWDIILFYYGKHVSNPKIAPYLDLRRQSILVWTQREASMHANNLLFLRNIPEVRSIVAEMMCVLCYANKGGRSFEECNLKSSDYELTRMSLRFKAPHVHYADPVILPVDPKEFFVAVNELVFSLQEGHTLAACYWCDWIMYYHTHSPATTVVVTGVVKKPSKQKAATRAWIPVDPVFQSEIDWILWDAIFTQAMTPTPTPTPTPPAANDPTPRPVVPPYIKLIKKILDSLLSLYLLEYSPGTTYKRRYPLVYFAAALVCDKNPRFDEEVLREKQATQQVLDNLSLIYRQIKKNEVAPPTDYMFYGLQLDAAADAALEGGGSS
jgi:hypothetical protein